MSTVMPADAHAAANVNVDVICIRKKTLRHTNRKQQHENSANNDTLEGHIYQPWLARDSTSFATQPPQQGN
ncbi:hypothetical protein C5167_001118 [Papaver somniferum]|uniref:Uncharacterized protein n=1 Tax=Papaver somniferum TaxID=3469 RepID=A0A4Y7KX46_PAPSO|nr:hypothetical protein C5167_001118 [Papaver somniferum]